MIKELRFSFNWNNKLNCKSFSTLRLYNPDKYAIGNVLHVMLKTKQRWVTDFGTAEVVEMKKIKGSELNEAICRIDTGYSLGETKGILKKMYKGKDIDRTAFSFVILAYRRT